MVVKILPTTPASVLECLGSTSTPFLILQQVLGFAIDLGNLDWHLGVSHQMQDLLLSLLCPGHSNKNEQTKTRMTKFTTLQISC